MCFQTVNDSLFISQILDRVASLLYTTYIHINWTLQSQVYGVWGRPVSLALFSTVSLFGVHLSIDKQLSWL